MKINVKLADVYSTEEYTAVIFECIETLKPEFVIPSHKVKDDDIYFLL